MPELLLDAFKKIETRLLRFGKKLSYKKCEWDALILALSAEIIRNYEKAASPLHNMLEVRPLMNLLKKTLHYFQKYY